jgi:predicted dehydrogenase
VSPNGRKTLLVGFGKIAAGYAQDLVMARHYQYASHAQVLVAHPCYSWDSVIDPDEAALERAERDWDIPYTAKAIDDLVFRDEIEVAVLANPPGGRLELLESLSGIKAVVIEKPLALSREVAQELLDYCRQRRLVVQVNLPRRADITHRQLADGDLTLAIGKVQGGYCLYGNGLYNNGSHMVDLVRMLVGEIATVQTLSTVNPFSEGPLVGDENLAFILTTENGAIVSFHPLHFEDYRENGLDLWGEKGRLSLLQEGLLKVTYPCVANRALTGAKEIASDQAVIESTTLGDAFYQVYENLDKALREDVLLASPGESALRTEAVLDAVRYSSVNGGEVVSLS